MPILHHHLHTIQILKYPNFYISLRVENWSNGEHLKIAIKTNAPNVEVLSFPYNPSLCLENYVMNCMKKDLVSAHQMWKLLWDKMFGEAEDLQFALFIIHAQSLNCIPVNLFIWFGIHCLRAEAVVVLKHTIIILHAFVYSMYIWILGS